MGTRLGDKHRESPSDHGRPYHEMGPVARAASHQPGAPEKPEEAKEIKLRPQMVGELTEDLMASCPPDMGAGDLSPEEREEMASDLAEVSRKFDQGKPACAIIDPSFIEGMGAVLTFGEEKYDRMNWAGLTVERLMSSHQRHTMAILRGEDLDPESGQRHAYHAACCLMMADWIIKNRGEQDDRRFKSGEGG